MFRKILIGIFLLLSTTVEAQQVDFGIKAGVNFSTFNGDGSYDISNRTGYHLGLTGEILISDKFSFQSEVLYSTQGAEVEMVAPARSFEENIKLEYISVPLLAKYYFIPGFSLEVGPQISYLVKAKNEFLHETEDMKDEAEKINVAIAGGLSYKFPVGLVLSGRYNLGLIKAVDDPKRIPDPNWRNRVLQLSVGYKF